MKLLRAFLPPFAIALGTGIALYLLIVGGLIPWSVSDAHGHGPDLEQIKRS